MKTNSQISRKMMPITMNAQGKAMLNNIGPKFNISKSDLVKIAQVAAPMVAAAAPKSFKTAQQAAYYYQTLRDAGVKMPTIDGIRKIPSVLKPTNVFAPSKQSNDMTAMNSSYGLSKAPEPKPVILNSRIVPNTYSNDYMPAVQGLCAPMHVSSVGLVIPTSTANPLSAYFLNTICFDIQTRAQANVGYDLQVSTQFTPALLTTAFNSAIYALQVYYWYASILSYESDPRNKNSGMIALRQGITSQMISDLNQLGHRLEDTPVPPRLVQWVKYMSSNFFSGPSQGASITKTCFSYAAFVGTPPAISYPAQALTSLNSAANTTVFALLRRSIPQWRIGKLYDVTTTPNFDPNFKTIFANLPTSFYSSLSQQNQAPNGSNSSSAISYNTYNNRLDGVAYAMASVYSVADTAWLPGLVVPVSAGAVTGADSRWSYSDIGAGPSWNRVSESIFLTLSRDESIAFPTTTQQTPHLAGAEKCQSVTGLTLIQTAQNTLDYLFDINSIPVKGDLSSFNNIVKYSRTQS
jgi:hypothetical protein